MVCSVGDAVVGAAAADESVRVEWDDATTAVDVTTMEITTGDKDKKDDRDKMEATMEMAEGETLVIDPKAEVKVETLQTSPGVKEDKVNVKDEAESGPHAPAASSPPNNPQK